MADQNATQPEANESVIRFEDVHLGFGQGDVLRGISFTVEPRETKLLLGESGSGKTLLLKLGAGLLCPDAGRVFVMGGEISAMSERDLLSFRRQIGFVFQEGALFDSLTVSENVAFALHEEHVPEDEVEQRVDEALKFVELEDVLEKLPGELSGGMRRRVSIARALVTRPKIVFYDSPTAGLDPVTAQTIIALILRLRDVQGVTSLMATHRVQDAFGMAHFHFEQDAARIVPWTSNGSREARPPTSIIVLRDGQAYFQGDPEALLKSKDEYLKQFLVTAS